ncbi:MAG: hypothetical protein P1Q69_04230 [Candidatus Thorarchaeota archaeon]|nr:hypothetical protein [Candidatus Thorarchaeota archaeon]
MTEPNLRVNLVEERGETSVFIDAEIDADGRLIITGEDIGKTPEEFWGDSDYEYWVAVEPDQKDRVLLALIETLYKGDMQVVSKFRNLLSEKGIPSEFGSWV